MTPRDTQQAIISSDLMPSEKLVGLIVIFHINARTGQTRLRQHTIADECGLSIPSVKRAIRSLVKAGILACQSTGRSSIFSLPSVGNNTSNVEGSPMIYQMDHDDTSQMSSRYALDTEFSTPGEEKNKLEEARLRREESGQFSF